MHASAAAAALAVQTYIDQHNLLDNVKSRGDQLFDTLRKRFSEHPYIGDIRGRGLFCGIELVQDRQEKIPFSPDSKLDGKIKSTAMENGLMVYPNAGTIDGQNGHHILVAPPFICTVDQIDEIVDKLEKSINTTISNLP